jgi:Calx-beta domain-containing protein
MNRTILALFATLFAATAFAADPTNPILFVTQVPMPEEVNTRTIPNSYMSCVSPFGSHLGDTAFAGRGGSLWVRFPANANASLNHQLIDLLAVANWSAIAGGKPAANTIAVRNPCVYWDKSKAVFSMVAGAPSGPNDNTNFIWQLYEITLPTQAQLNAAVQPTITKVANQPAYNNIMPCYTPGGQFIFASDRPYNGQPHLTQREEYLSLPTVSGLWKLDATANTLQLLHHAPSGSFSPSVDSAGRLIFVNWDHLSRDIEAMTDERDSDPNFGEPDPNTFSGWHSTGNGSGNFDDESIASAFTLGLPYGQGPHLDFFPEPRNADKKTLILEWNNSLNGVTTNIFLPWMINLDGSGGEILNHVGRHEVAGFIRRSFNTDNNLVDLNPSVAPGYGGLVAHNFFSNLFWVREDPLQNGTFFGTDSVDLGTHGAGQIVKLTNAGANQNPDTMQVSYITGSVTGATKPQNIPIVRVGMNITQPPSPFTPLTTPETLYRTPVPLADGALIASTATGIDQTDWNRGTVSQPSTPWNFRLKSLKLQSGVYVPDVTLTNGLTITTSYFVPGVSQAVTFTNVSAWELDPAEIVARTPPAATASTVDPIEASVFASNGVHIPTFQNYLVQQNAALGVSRNVTKRDLHDRQQPYNLKVAWSNTQTTAPLPNNAPIYTVGWVQFLQADLRRGYLLGGGTPAEGRRVVATPLHDTMAENVIVPGAPAGSVRLGDDGSFAAILPAEKALTWHLLDNDAAKTSQVKERFWVTFKKGEIRTCANCHGINTSDQSGTVANPVTKPTNPPQALATLLQSWKGTHPVGVVQHASASLSVAKSSGAATLSVVRTNGSTGLVAVDFSTANGTALSGSDYSAASGTLSWADGDITSKPITINLLNNPAAQTSRTFAVNLSNPLYGSLGAQSSATVTLTAAAATPSPTAIPSPTSTPSPTATPSSTASPTSTPGASPTPQPAQFGNISSRVSVGTGNNVLIAGFIITGNQPKKVIIRAIGPSLPIAGVLADPVLEFHDAGGQLLAANDNWGDSPNIQAIIDSTIAPTHDKESAIVATLAPAAYTAVVSGANAGTGLAVVEVYDLDTAADSKLANISTRAPVQTGNDILIGGFIVLGQQPQNVIVRALGPSLPFGGTLSDPTLELHDGNGAQLASNDNWRTDQMAEIIATTIPPTNDAESAIVATLQPGTFTAVVRGANGATGVGLVEIYQLP